MLISFEIIAQVKPKYPKSYMYGKNRRCIGQPIGKVVVENQRVELRTPCITMVEVATPYK